MATNININQFTLISNLEMDYLELGYNIASIIGVITRVDSNGLNHDVRQTLSVCMLDNLAGRSIRLIFWNPNDIRFEQLVAGQIVAITCAIIMETNQPRSTIDSTEISPLIIHIDPEDTVVHWLGMRSSEVSVTGGRAIVERLPRSSNVAPLELSTWGEAGRRIPTQGTILKDDENSGREGDGRGL